MTIKGFTNDDLELIMPESHEKAGIKISKEDLQAMMTILHDYDMATLSTKQAGEVIGRLKQAGLLNPGKLTGISASLQI